MAACECAERSIGVCSQAAYPRSPCGGSLDKRRLRRAATRRLSHWGSMRFLLDTQAFIWWDTKSAQLSPRARSLCDDLANTMVLSIASAWEMQIKIQIGKMQLAVPLATIID